MFSIGVLLEWLNNAIFSFIIPEENQIEFRMVYQTSDYTFTLRAILENTFEYSKVPPALFVFVDFEKAFDSVDHTVCFIVYCFLVCYDQWRMYSLGPLSPGAL